MTEKKITLVLFISIFLFIGILYLNFSKQVFSSKILLNFDNYPPLFGQNLNDSNKKLVEDKILSDFKNLFFSKKQFEAWKSKNESYQISFEYFDTTKLKNNFIVSKNVDEVLVSIDNKNNQNFINVNSNNLKHLDEIYQYCIHTNKTLRDQYITILQDMLANVKMLSVDNPSYLETKLRVEIFLNNLKIQKDNIISIKHPTQPIQISPESYLFVLTLSFILGTLVAIIYVLLGLVFKQAYNVSSSAKN